MNGFLVIDKPSGITSFDVVARVRRACLAARGPIAAGEKKLRVGHLGTLDPLATGVLVIAVGEASKLIEFLMGAEKVYDTQIELGKMSDTYDKEGTIEVKEESPDISREDLEGALLSFVGEIDQIPPAYSAIKVKGKRAYELARKGEEVNLKSRKVMIHSIKVRGFQPPFVMLEIHCGSGTYIRSIAHDLGQKLGVGGLMTELRRSRVGDFHLDQAIQLKEDEAPDYSSHFISLEKVVEDWPAMQLADKQIQLIRNGQRIFRPPAFITPDSKMPICGFYEGKLATLLEEDGRFMKVVKNFVVN
jgi:tRNA pseudouridine55 synthase